MNTKYLLHIITFAFSIFLLSCNSEMPNASENDIKDNKLFVSSINLEASINDEIELIDTDAANTTRSIKLTREGNKFVSRLAGVAGSNISPLYLVVKGPYGRFISPVNATVSEDKKLKISEKNMNFGDPSTMISDAAQGGEWQGKLFFGGTYNSNVKSLQFNEQLPIIRGNDYWTNFDSYIGKIPFASDWFDLELSSQGGGVFSLKDKTKVITLRPTGNLLRLRFYNPEANATLRSQNISRILFESDDLVSRGEILLDRDGHNWRSLTRGQTQTAEYYFPQAHQYIPVQPQSFADAYIWVDSAYGGKTKITIDYAKDHIQGTMVLLDKTDTPGTIVQGKSSMIWLTLPD